MIDFFKSMFTSKLGRIFLAFGLGVAIFGTLTWWLNKDEFEPPRDSMVRFYDALVNVTFCYETEIGNPTFKGSADCPPKEELDQVEAEYMLEFDATPDQLQHDGTVFVSELINCTTCNTCRVEALGCTNGVDIVVQTTRDWRRTLKVELGHVMSLHRHGEIDPDHKRPYYPRGTY